jgi:hypothetical protein
MSRSRKKKTARRTTRTQHAAGLRMALRRLMAPQPGVELVDDADAAALAERLDRARVLDAVGARLIREGLADVASALRSIADAINSATKEKRT